VNTRRSFFKRIAGLVAIVAIAPELAFRAKLALPAAEDVAVSTETLGAFWTQTERHSVCVSAAYEEYMEKLYGLRANT
jgi:hypothetical protein